MDKTKPWYETKAGEIAGYHAGPGGRDVCQSCLEVIPDAGEPGESLRTTDKRNRVVHWSCYVDENGRPPSNARSSSR